MVSPFFRVRKPMPPARVIPPIPTEPESPRPVTRPRSAVAIVYSAAVAPVSTQALVAVGVDLDSVHARQVDHESAVGGAVAGAAVATTADREVEPGLPRGRHDPCDIGGAGYPRHRQRPPVEPLEENVARLVVGGILGA